MKLRVLCLDIEGGHGGSSRSLLQALRGTGADARLDAKVLCRRGGWIEQAYRDAKIPCEVAPAMPTLTALVRFDRNLAAAVLFWIWIWPRSRAFRARFLAMADEADLVHCNHVSLTPLARWLRRMRPDKPISMHIRTMPVRSAFSARQSRLARRVCDGFVYITANEREHFECLAGRDSPGDVIFNPVEPFDDRTAAHAGIPRDDRLRVACLSNFSFNRGIDRLIDVAAALPDDKRDRILFVVAGDTHLRGKLPGVLGEIARRRGSLADYARMRGVESSFLFLGYIEKPETVLAGVDVLLKPTREYNPWGRDILEALAAGVPVASVGIDRTFVETGVTGFLQPFFDAEKLAAWLLEIDADRPRLKTLGQAGGERVTRLCATDVSIGKLENHWRRTMRRVPARDEDFRRVTSVLPSLAAGGAERVLLSMAGGLAPDKFAKRLIVVDPEGALDISGRGFTSLECLDRSRLRKAILPLLNSLYRARPDIVFSSHIHINIFVLLASSLLGYRCVVREANMPSASLANRHWPGWIKPLYRWALRRAAVVIATSDKMALEFETIFAVPGDRIAVIHNPVDRDAIRATAVKPKRQPGGGRRFVAVGRLVDQKGFDRLLDWMNGCDTADRLLIIGEGPNRKDLERKILDLGLVDRVTLTGFLAVPWPHISGADALILSSRWEGMPNVALEALACGTPVIATAASGGIEEIASAAPSGAVIVAETGDEVVAAMRAMRPAATAKPRPSLLPDCFLKERALEKFEALLRLVLENRRV